MARCLERQGYEATTIADVAAEARVSKRTFCEQFESKQDCVMALYRRGAAECLSSVREAASAAPAEGDRLEAGFRAMFEHFARHAARSKVVIMGIIGLGEVGLKLREEGHRQLLRLLSEHAGVSTDEVPPSEAQGLLGVFCDWTLSAFASDSAQTLPERAARAAHVFRAGLAAIRMPQPA